MFLSNIIRKTRRKSIDTITFDLGDLESSMSRSLRFRRLISRKGAELGHILLFNINRKAHMWGLITLSHLTLSNFERSKSRSLRFRSIIFRKGAVRPYATIKH